MSTLPFSPPRALLALPLLLILAVSTAGAHDNIRSPATLEELTLTPRGDGTAVVTFRAAVAAPGVADMKLHLPQGFGLLRSPTDARVNLPGPAAASWTISLPQRGGYLIQASLSLTGANPGVRPDFAEFQTFELYVELADGAVTWQANAPAERHRAEVLEVDRPGFEKGTAERVPLPNSESRIEEIRRTGPDGRTVYDIYVFIYGNIQYLHGDDYCLGGPTYGVPNVAVYLDWDYDNDVNTGYTPYFGSGILHAGYDITQMDGSYYFAFHWESSQPASAYSDVIRVYCNRSNGHAFNGDEGVGGWLPAYHYIDITGATDYIYENDADVTVSSYDGGALRFLYRSRLFAEDQLGYSTTAYNRYYIRTGESNSFFCCSGTCTSGPQPGVPFILFNRIPDAHVTYHEHAHYVDCMNMYDLPNDWGQAHWFELVTTQNEAWIEGWAEFSDAACALYWAALEDPAYVENYEYYQFLEDTQRQLPSGVDRRKVEGAVASFLFNLYDSTDERQPGYFGENDDLTVPGTTILGAFNLAEFLSCSIGGGSCNDMIREFRDQVKSAVGTQRGVSVQAMYDYFLGDTGAPRSATPDQLSVYGSDDNRTLSWNDLTSPTSVGYQCFTVNPERNNETGFQVYRKAGGGTWDGTLAGYTPIHTTAADATTWSDTSLDRTTQSYVVVATNAGGVSVPLAQDVWWEAPDASIAGPTQVNSGATGTWTGSATGGTSPYTYRWYTATSMACAGPWIYRATGSTFQFSATGDYCIRLEVQGANGSIGTEAWPVDVLTGGGGCPYLYTFDGTDWSVENTLLRPVPSERAGTGASDIVDRYLLKARPDATNGRIDLAIREFEREHSYFDAIELAAVYHPKDANVAVAPSGDLVVYDGRVLPTSAVDANGRDRLEEVGSEDGRFFRGDPGDVLTLTYPSAELDGSSVFGAVAKRKPDIEIGLGDDDGQYSAGIRILVVGDDRGEKIRRTVTPREMSGLILAPGTVPADKDESESVTLRLEWITEHELDFAAFYRTIDADVRLETLELAEVRASGPGARSDAIERSDDTWLEIRPEQEVELSFAAPAVEGISYLLTVEGHYFRIPSEDSPASLPAEFALAPVAPNPVPRFAGTDFRFSLPEPGIVTLHVYDVTGRKVRTVLDATPYEAGGHHVHWDGRASDGRALAPGVYFTRLSSGAETRTRKLLVLE